jgi:hypothetical protein
MVRGFRILVQILMVVLTLGIWTPSPACAAAVSEEVKSCCCTQSPACECPVSKPCAESCTLAKGPISDKQLPGRNATAPTARGQSFLFAIAPIKISYPVLVSAFRQRDTNASPPLGGSPPQARFCLWLI